MSELLKDFRNDIYAAVKDGARVVVDDIVNFTIAAAYMHRKGYRKVTECGKCKCNNPSKTTEEYVFCCQHNKYMSPTDYCSEGEPKEGKE